MTQARIDQLALVAEFYCARVGRYPAGFEEMERFTGELTEAGGCRFHYEDTRDAWGQPIYYGLVRGTPMIVSAGADGRFTTPDDVTLPGSREHRSETIDVRKDCPVR